MAITSYAQLGQLINTVLEQDGELGDVPHAPHASFWTSLSYDEFVYGNVPGVSPPVPILVIGDSKNSNLIQALQGVGPLFGPNGSIGQMPADGPPFFTDDQIAEIAAWIDARCPDPAADVA
jgi:hypothetical protein